MNLNRYGVRRMNLSSSVSIPIRDLMNLNPTIGTFVGLSIGGMFQSLLGI